MSHTTSVDPIRFRELARRLEAEASFSGGRTPAGALTTIAGALQGSLIEKCHGAVAVDILEWQEEVTRMFSGEIDSLRAAAERFDQQEQANTDAIGRAGEPR